MRRALVLLIGLWSAAAWGEDTEYSVEEYLELRESLSAADDALAEIDGDSVEARAAATSEVIDAVLGLIAYLNGWSETGTMSADLVAESRVQRFVLFENLVQLYADLGACAAARSSLEAMRVLEPSNLGPEMEGLRWSSQRVVESCEPEPLVIVESVEHRISPWAGRVFTTLGSTTLVAGSAILLADISERSDYNTRVELLGAPLSGTADPSLEAEYERLQRRRTAGVTLTAIGASLATSGAVLWRASRPRGQAVEASVALRGRGGLVSLRF